MASLRSYVLGLTLCLHTVSCLRLQSRTQRVYFTDVYDFDDAAASTTAQPSNSDAAAAGAGVTSADDAAATSTNVVYGVMTNNRPDYQAKLQAQLETWAAEPLASKRFVAVTGVGGDMPSDMDQKGMYLSTCDDRYKGVPCKEERLMEIGYAKGADWLVILGEDNYVDTKALEKRLAFAKSDLPTVLGLVGDRTDTRFCPEMAQQLFGGGGYALNKAALQKLLSSGQQELRGARIMSEQSLLALTKKGPFTYHYLTPDVMRWLHATLQHGAEEDISSLASRAFVHGCCCASNDKQQKACEAAVAQASAPAEASSSASE